jgi:hypothetical protein
MEIPMSKADSSPSTAAPASKSRRDVTLGAGGIAALCATSAALAAASNLSSETQSLTAEIRRLHARHYALVDHEMSIEVQKSDPNYPAYEAAISASLAAWDELEALAKRILARPVQSWADVAVLAELAKATTAGDEFEGDPADVESFADLATAANVAAVQGALLMGGDHA